MKKFMNFQGMAFALLITLFLTSCEAESIEASAEIQETNLTVTKSELEGEWELTGMIADDPVDLNNDGVASFNLLDEASCFDRMNAVFNNDGSFSTINGRLDFNSGENQDEFTCGTDRQDFGTWDLKDENVLMLTLTINGQSYTHNKNLDFNGDTFAFEISKFESDEYVDNQEESVAKDVRILYLEYSRVK